MLLGRRRHDREALGIGADLGRQQGVAQPIERNGRPAPTLRTAEPSGCGDPLVLERGKRARGHRLGDGRGRDAELERRR